MLNITFLLFYQDLMQKITKLRGFKDLGFKILEVIFKGEYYFFICDFEFFYQLNLGSKKSVSLKVRIGLKDTLFPCQKVQK